MQPRQLKHRASRPKQLLGSRIERFGDDTKHLPSCKRNRCTNLQLWRKTKLNITLRCKRKLCDRRQHFLEAMLNTASMCVCTCRVSRHVCQRRRHSPSKVRDHVRCWRHSSLNPNGRIIHIRWYSWNELNAQVWWHPSNIKERTRSVSAFIGGDINYLRSAWMHSKMYMQRRSRKTIFFRRRLRCPRFWLVLCIPLRPLEEKRRNTQRVNRCLRRHQPSTLMSIITATLLRTMEMALLCDGCWPTLVYGRVLCYRAHYRTSFEIYNSAARLKMDYSSLCWRTSLRLCSVVMTTGYVLRWVFRAQVKVYSVLLEFRPTALQPVRK